MQGRKPSYLPVTSIVVAIVILALVVGFASFRDIQLGRRRVTDVLGRQARLIMVSLGAALRAGISGRDWQRGRLDMVLEEAAHDREIAYLAILDTDGTILVHSDPARVGAAWPGDVRVRAPSPGQRVLGEVVTADGNRIYQATAVLDPLGTRPPMTRRRARPALRPHSPEDIEKRLSELLGRTLTPGEPVELLMVVGLDMTELEAAFLLSKNHTILLSTVLLVVGAAAIYFLFLVQHYRSVRTALANMRSYTTNVIESMASGLISLDADGRVVTTSSSARSLLGLEGKKVTGEAHEEVFSLEPGPARDRVLGVVAGRAEMVETDVGIVVGEERIPAALSASSLRDEDGRRAGTVLLFQDLREMEALKEEVERERHLASLGRLAAGVAHEIRNPLSSLKGFTQFLRSKFQPGSQEERYADIMIEEVERLDRVVQELLDFARPNEPKRVPADPNEVVEGALSLISEDAAFRKVAIERRLGADLPRILVDTQQITQALLNVLLNGIEAMPAGGTLTIETSVSRERQGPMSVSIAVTDTGEGMDEEELAKLFEPFYTTKQGGTGLGLTIVSRVLEQNGGHIHMSSVKGQGSSFFLRLPIEAREGPPGRSSDAETRKNAQDAKTRKNAHEESPG